MIAKHIMKAAFGSLLIVAFTLQMGWVYPSELPKYWYLGIIVIPFGWGIGHLADQLIGGRFQEAGEHYYHPSKAQYRKFLLTAWLAVLLVWGIDVMILHGASVIRQERADLLRGYHHRDLSADLLAWVVPMAFSTIFLGECASSGFTRGRLGGADGVIESARQRKIEALSSEPRFQPVVKALNVLHTVKAEQGRTQQTSNDLKTKKQDRKAAVDKAKRAEEIEFSADETAILRELYNQVINAEKAFNEARAKAVASIPDQYRTTR